MFRYTENWEDFDEKYALDDNLDTNDLTLTGNFCHKMNNTNLKFSTEKVLNSDNGKLESSSESQLEVENEHFNFQLTRSDDEKEAMIETKVWKHKDLSMNLYGKFSDNDGHQNFSGQVIYYLNDNKMFNVGYERSDKNNEAIYNDGNTTKTNQNFTLGGMMQLYKQNEHNAYGGLRMATNIKFLNSLQGLVGYNNNLLNFVVSFGLARSETDHLLKLFKMGSEVKVTNDLSLIGHVDCSIEDDHVKNDWRLGGRYEIDERTGVNFRLECENENIAGNELTSSHDLSLTASITRKFRNLIDFTFSARYDLKNDKAMRYLKPKYGFSVGFSEDS